MNRRADALGRDPEAGFTMVELLVVIVLLAVIALPVGNAVIGILRNTDATNARLAASHDAQISAAYFAADVASTGVQLSGGSGLGQSVEQNAAYNAGLFPCGTAGTPPAALRLAWDEYTLTGGTVIPSRVVVSYVVEPTSTGHELHRIRCQGATTPTSDVVVAHQLTAAAPGVTCSSTCTAAAPVPQRISLTLALTDPGGSGSYSVVLTGQRRQT
jgi:prepilin-type N-terminal cleavage/methylation domain-containing protein